MEWYSATIRQFKQARLVSMAVLTSTADLNRPPRAGSTSYAGPVPAPLTLGYADADTKSYPVSYAHRHSVAHTYANTFPPPAIIKQPWPDGFEG
jgi:hypothetical protein